MCQPLRLWPYLTGRRPGPSRLSSDRRGPYNSPVSPVRPTSSAVWPTAAASIVILLIAAVITGCGGSDAPSPVAVATVATGESRPPAVPTQTPDADAPRASLAARTAAASPPAPTAKPSPRLRLSAERVRQGGVFTVRVGGEGLDAGLVFVGTHTYSLGRRDGGLWAAVAVAVDEPPGDKAVVAEFTDETGASHRLTATLAVTQHQFPVDYVDLEPETAALLDPELVAREQRLLLATLRGFSGYVFDLGARRPVEGEITTTFGETRVYNGRDQTGDHHRGMDIGADEGAPVVAAAGGMVALARALPVRGNYILVDHGLGVFTGYAHLSKLLVAEGDIVDAGRTIGLVGSTGLSTGPHLHWDAVAQGTFFDPQELLGGALAD